MSVKELGEALDALNTLFNATKQNSKKSSELDAAYKKLADQLEQEETTLRLYFDYESQSYVLL